MASGDLPATERRAYASMVNSEAMTLFARDLASTLTGARDFALRDGTADLDRLARSCCAALDAAGVDHAPVPYAEPTTENVRRLALEVRGLLDRCLDVGLDLEAVAGEHPLAVFIIDGAANDAWMMARGFRPSCLYAHKIKVRTTQRKGWMR